MHYGDWPSITVSMWAPLALMAVIETLDRPGKPVPATTMESVATVAELPVTLPADKPAEKPAGVPSRGNGGRQRQRKSRPVRQAEVAAVKAALPLASTTDIAEQLAVSERHARRLNGASVS